MLYRLGRFLQFLGLIILPVAIAGNMAEKLDLRLSLSLSAAGMGVFFVGWLLQQGARPR
jgi:hypothetical protein